MTFHPLSLIPGTDGILALGVARIILANGWIDSSFIRSFTDLPLLVRMDTGERLRASDLHLGKPDEFVAVLPTSLTRDGSDETSRYEAILRG